MKKRTLSLVLALALCLPLLPTNASAANVTQFTDVKAGWYYDAVAWAVENEITEGTTATTFSPSDTCTNAEILTFLWRAAGKPEPTISNPFTNLSDCYYYKPALWAYEKGLVSGSSFDADRDCTRGMSVTYIWKAKEMPFSKAPANFVDVPASNYELSMPVAWASEAGVTTGTDANGTMFSPDDTCTRAEIVTFLARAYGGVPAAGSSTGTTATQPLDAKCEELLKLINAERSKAGLNALETTAQLTQAAQIRAGEISKGYLEHRPDGSEWSSVLAQAGVSATYAHESMLGGYSTASGTFSMAMNTPDARTAILSADLTHIGIGYAYNTNGYGGYQDFWSLLYITDKSSPSSSTSSEASSSSSEAFTPVPMEKLANLKSLQKSATDDQFAQAYAVALEIVKPLAGLSMQEQLQGIANAIRARFDSGMEYSMSSPHYNDPYGYFILGSASCAGCTRATGLCLNILGIPYEHVNEDGYTHQWCRVNVNGTYWICDAYGLYCGPEPAPYTHPYL